MNINKKLKRFIITSLSLVLLMSSLPSFAATTRYKDVSEKHWAYSYIEDMSKLGFLSGYPEGNFLPSGDLTFLESMSTLSRFVNLSPTDEKKAMDEYGSLLKELNVTIPWEEKGLSAALYSDIISEGQLREASKSGIFNRPVSREVIAEFLAKAMGLQDKIDKKLIRKELPYKDLKDINEYRVVYVDILLDIGILSPQGRDNGKFEPRATLTRAEMSKLLSEGYDYLQRNPVERVPEKSEPVEKEMLKGIIREVEEQIGRRKITMDTGLDYILEEDVEIELDGKKADHSILYPGQEVEIELAKGKNNILSMRVESFIEEDLEGIVKSLNASTRKMSLDYKDGNKVASREYIIDKDAKLSLDDENIKLSDLRIGDLIEVQLKNNKIIEIKVISKSEKLEGYIVEISPVKEGKDKEYFVSIENDKGNIFKFFANEDTYIYRNKSKGKLEDLKVRDEAYIISEYDLINEYYVAKDIEANIVKRDIKGYVIEVTTRHSENTKLVIENTESNKEEVYELTRDAVIKIDDKVVSSIPNNTGYYVEIKLEGDIIKEINVDASSSEESYMGSISDYDRKNSMIEVTIDRIGFEKSRKVDIYIDKDKTKILSKDYKKELKIEDLYVGYRVNVIGKYQGMNFVADTIHLR